jgi:outer membrane lipoprotein-sorting protein
MAGKRQAALIAMVTAGLVGAATLAAAQPVPLPPPAPLPKTDAGPRPPSSVGPAGPAARPSTAPSQAPSQGGSLRDWLPPIFGGKEPEPQKEPQKEQKEKQPGLALEPGQRTLVDKVSAYLTRVQVMSGDFAQIGPDGRQSKGQFYVQKPGKVRFDYDEPSRIDIIADGSSVVVRDRKLATQDVYPLSQTPLRFLLADRIDLLRDTNIVGVYADDLFVSVVVEEKHVLVGTSKLMMMFGAKDFQLKQWVVTDPQGYDTTVALSNLDTARRPDPGMFKIDYTQYPN